MLSDHQLTQFHEQGYIVIPDAFADIGVERVFAAYQQARKQTEAAWHQATAANIDKGEHRLGAAAHQVLDLFKYDPLFLDLANNPTIISILEQVVGPDLQLTEMIGHHHPANTPTHIGWHRDWPPWSHPTQILKAKVFYYLEDIADDMGPYSVVPGSHTWPHDPPGSVNSFSTEPPTEELKYDGETLEDMPHMIKVSAPAGTAVIANVALWHTATANTSTRHREVIICGYTHFWVKQWEDRTPPQEMIDWADTPQKRQLMGIHAVQGRAAWDRSDIPYLPEHQILVDAKPF